MCSAASRLACISAKLLCPPGVGVQLPDVPEARMMELRSPSRPLSHHCYDGCRGWVPRMFPRLPRRAPVRNQVRITGDQIP